mmetsp:Transcript_49206/g.107285  ORF Transcript_49206/g.107285 Transcript_49206/m.107285 type:complete len:201 (-) Transcript_49206:1284-1886(-)
MAMSLGIPPGTAVAKVSRSRYRRVGTPPPERQAIATREKAKHGQAKLVDKRNIRNAVLGKQAAECQVESHTAAAQAGADWGCNTFQLLFVALKDDVPTQPQQSGAFHTMGFQQRQNAAHTGTCEFAPGSSSAQGPGQIHNLWYPCRCGSAQNTFVETCGPTEHHGCASDCGCGTGGGYLGHRPRVFLADVPHIRFGIGFA